MTNRKFDILIPFERFRITVILGTADGPSDMEKGLLSAICHDCRTVYDIVTNMSIGYRPVIDLLLGCWRKGYIYLDLDTNYLVVSPKGEVFIKDNENQSGSRSASAKNATIDTNLMYDLLTGMILPFKRIGKALGSTIAAPRLLPTGSYLKASQADMIAALRRHPDLFRKLRYKEAQGFRVSRQRHQAGSLRTIEYVKAELRVQETDSGALAIEVLDHERNLGRAAQEIASALQDFVREKPDNIFSRRLFDFAEKGTEQVQVSLDEAFRQFDVLVDDIRADGVTNADEAYHARLYAEASRLYDEVVELTRYQGDFEILTTSSEIKKAVDHIFRPLCRQIVVSVPAFDYGPMQDLRDHILEHVNHEPNVGEEQGRCINRRVFMIWGDRTDGDYHLPFEKSSLLHGMREAGTDLLKVSPKPCGVGTSFIIRDDKEAIYFIHDFFLEGHERVPIAVRLGGKSTGREGASTGLKSLSKELRWVREIHPDYPQGSTVVSDFPDDQSGTLALETIWTPPVNIFKDADFTGDDSMQEELLGRWLERWKKQADNLRAKFTAVSGLLRISHNEEIGGEVLDLMRTPGDVFLGLSKMLESTFSRHVMEILRDRVKKGLSTYIVGTFNPGFSINSIFEYIFNDGLEDKDLLKWKEDGNWQGLVVCTESTLLVSSAQGNIPFKRGRGTMGRHVGLRLDDIDIAKDFWRRLVVKRYDFPEFDTVASCPDAESSEVFPMSDVRLDDFVLDLLIAKDNREKIEELVSEWIHNSRTHSKDLKKLIGRLPADMYRSLIILAIHYDILSADEKREWLAVLAWEYWRMGEFHESLILSHTVGWNHDVPPRWLHTLVLDRSIDKISYVYLTENQAAEAEAAALSASTAVCFYGAGELFLDLPELVESLKPSAIRDITSAMVEYWEKTRTRFPSYLFSQAGGEPKPLSTEQAFKEYCEIFNESDEKTGIMTFDNKVCNHVVKIMLRGEGYFGELMNELNSTSNKVRPTIAREWLKKNGNDSEKILKRIEAILPHMPNIRRPKVIGGRRDKIISYIRRSVHALKNLKNSNPDLDENKLQHMNALALLKKRFDEIEPDLRVDCDKDTDRGRLTAPLIEILIPVLNRIGSHHG